MRILLIVVCSYKLLKRKKKIFQKKSQKISKTSHRNSSKDTDLEQPKGLVYIYKKWQRLFSLHPPRAKVILGKLADSSYVYIIPKDFLKIAFALGR